MWLTDPVTRLACALGLCLILPAVMTPLRAQPRPPQQARPFQYEARVDLILADVNVVDAEGRPVEGLSVPDFRVFVNGRPRRIHTVQFVEPATYAADVRPPEPPHVSSNQGSAHGRLFMLVIDDESMSVGETRALDEPVAKFFAGLTPRDRVALVTIPYGGPRVDFTADLARVRRAVAQVVGVSALSSSLTQRTVGMAEALLFDARSPEWHAVVARECAGLRGEDARVCAMDVEMEARSKLADIRLRASASMGALRDIIRSLRGVDGPKTLVLVSGGLVLERHDILSTLIAEEAAVANTTIYVLHIERPLLDASVARPSPTQFEDMALGREGLEIVAGRARGEVFSVPTSAEFALARVARETSGYYLIGVEAEPDDRNGQAHQVRVELASPRRGLTLRSRREFRFDRAAAGMGSDGERLGSLIGTPGTIGDMPIRASAYAVRDQAGTRRRVLIAAEIDDLASEPETVLVGYTIVDRTGRERANRGERLPLRPVDPARPSPLRYRRLRVLEPGDYVLKLAVVRADGRRGSIEHPLALRPMPVGRLQVGNLFVLDVPDTGSVELRADVLTRVTGGRIAFYCELYASDASAFDGAEMTIEIAAAGDDVALRWGAARAGGTEAGRRTVQGAMTTATLEPGDYVARLVVTDRDGATGTVVRAFRVPADGR